MYKSVRLFTCLLKYCSYGTGFISLSRVLSSNKASCLDLKLSLLSPTPIFLFFFWYACIEPNENDSASPRQNNQQEKEQEKAITKLVKLRDVTINGFLHKRLAKPFPMDLNKIIILNKVV